MDNFSKNKIFDLSEVNAILDRIWYEASQFYPDKILGDVMCLSGLAAFNLYRDPSVWKPCDNIIIMINDDELFNFIQNSLPKIIKHKGVLRHKERTLYYFNTFYLEVWGWEESEMTTVEYNGIYLQQEEEIPAILL